MSKMNLLGSSPYTKQKCTSQSFDGKIYPDVHCHNGGCLNGANPKPETKLGVHVFVLIYLSKSAMKTTACGRSYRTLIQHLCTRSLRSQAW
jgi:hypothetical protein